MQAGLGAACTLQAPGRITSGSSSVAALSASLPILECACAYKHTHGSALKTRGGDGLSTSTGEAARAHTHPPFASTLRCRELCWAQ